MIQKFSAVRLRLDQSTFASDVRGQVTGVLYFSITAESFPNEKWDDFVTILLWWWQDALLRLLTGVQRSADLLFMDGPYRLHVSRLRGNELSVVRFARDRQFGDAILGDIRVLKSDLVAAAKVVLAYCLENGLANRDVDELVKRTAQLEQL